MEKSKQAKKVSVETKIKKNKSKKKIIVISVVSAVVVIILLLLASWFFFFKNDDNQESDTDNEVAEIVEEEPTEWEKSVKELIDKIDSEAKKINETAVCSDKVKDNCLTEEKKESKTKELNNFKKQVNELEENSDEKLGEIKTALEKFLNAKEDDEKTDTKEDTAKANSSTSNSNKTNNTSTPAPKPSTNTNNTASSSQFIKDVNSVTLNPVVTRNSYIDNEVGRIIGRVTNSSMSNYEKLSAVYNYVIKNMSYNANNNVFDLGEAYTKYQSYSYAFSFTGSDLETVYWAEQALRDRSGVCDTYAGFLLVLTRRLGFNTFTVAGTNTSGTGHTWNYIDTGNNKYILDAQGDDNGAASRNYYFGVNYNDFRTRYSAIHHVYPFNYFRESEDSFDWFNM